MREKMSCTKILRCYMINFVLIAMRINHHFHFRSCSAQKIHIYIYIYRQVSNIRRNFSRQLNCWSLRCSWSIACRRCSNYIFILNLTPGFNGLGKDNYKMRREAFKFWDLVRLKLETLRYIYQPPKVELQNTLGKLFMDELHWCNAMEKCQLHSYHAGKQS